MHTMYTHGYGACVYSAIIIIIIIIIVCFFNNSVSSSICKLPIRSEIYNCTVKNTNKVSIIIIMSMMMTMMMMVFLCREQYHLALNGLKDEKVFKMTYKMYLYWAQIYPTLFIRVVIKSRGAGDLPRLLWVWPRLFLWENKRKIEPKEIPSCLIARLLIVFARQLEILVTTLIHR